MSKAFTPKKQRKSIKLDRVAPSDFLHMNMMFACEHCSHYDNENDLCTIGYRAELHKKDIQMKRYLSTGHMAFCRFSEID